MKGKFSLFFTFSLFFFLLFSSCEDMFQSKISMSGENDSLDNLFKSVVEITKLDTPTQFYISPYYSSTEIRVTWNEVNGAAYYRIERAVSELGGEDPDEGNYEPLEHFVYGTSYTDKILKTPTLDSPEYNNKYFYRVSAFNTAMKYDESDPTAPLSAMLFRTPVNVTASGGIAIDHVMVSWERTQGANSYEIWRSDLSNGASASLLGTAMGNQYWFKNDVSAAEQGKDFFYMVTASNSFGNKTLMTRPAYGYARMSGAPEKPENVRLATGSGRGHSTTEIKIEWDAAGEPSAYYAVYRYSENDSSLTRLTEKTENTTLTDTQGLRPGIYYYYRVQAIVDDISSGRQLKSQFSSDDPEGFILSSPDEVVAEKNSNGNVSIKWKPAKGDENERLAYTYNVYASFTMDGNYSPVSSSVPPNEGMDGYIAANVTLDGGSFFKVSTYKGAAESNLSAAVSPSPSAAVILDASQRAFISVNEIANSNGVYPVLITWKKPDDDHPAFYHVQRSTKSGSGYSRITSTPLREDGSGNSDFYYANGIYTFIDRNESARVGRKYYYRVLSLNQLEQGSFPSDEKIGWGALTHNQYILEYNKTMNSALKKLTYMHKAGSTDKLGEETKYGGISGSIYYKAAIAGAGARIIIRLNNYADFYIENALENGVYFILSGESNTTANMSSNGNMDGTVTCTGMYPGKISYDRIEIKGGAAGGGTYGVQPDGGFPRVELSYTVIN